MKVDALVSSRLVIYCADTLAGFMGPKLIHQLIAPHAWRLPFERAWRDPNREGI